MMERVTDVVYRVQLTPRSKRRTVNRYRLWRATVVPDGWQNQDRTEDSATQHPTEDAMPEADPEDGGTTMRGLQNNDHDAAAVPAPAADTYLDFQTTRSGRQVRKPARFW